MNEERPSEVFRALMAGRPRGTQAELARTIGVRPQTVTKWLRGDVQLPIERWIEVERALGVDPLTIARRTGLLEHIPQLAEIPAERLETSWRASFGRGKQRREAVEAGGEQVALTVAEAAVVLTDLLRPSWEDGVAELREEVTALARVVKDLIARVEDLDAARKQDSVRARRPSRGSR